MMILYAVRPGGFDGGGGRAKSLSEVLGWTLPQLNFLCFGDIAYKGDNGANADLNPEEIKASIDQRYRDDPEFKKQYAERVRRAMQRAKEGLT